MGLQSMLPRMEIQRQRPIKEDLKMTWCSTIVKSVGSTNESLHSFRRIGYAFDNANWIITKALIITQTQLDVQDGLGVNTLYHPTDGDTILASAVSDPNNDLNKETNYWRWPSCNTSSIYTSFYRSQYIARPSKNNLTLNVLKNVKSLKK